LAPASDDLFKQLDALRQQGFATQTGELREDQADTGTDGVRGAPEPATGL